MTRSIVFSIPSKSLATKQKRLRGEGALEQALDLRAHRTISWLSAAEGMKEDHDVCFILLWIGFNAAYDDGDAGASHPAARRLFREFLKNLSRLDNKNRIQDATWNRYRNEIRFLVESKYLFEPFWNYQNGTMGYDDWPEQFDRHIARFSNSIYQHNTDNVLSMTFDCLYVLRNQILHGGATWKSRVNRRQVEDGVSIIAYMLPLFVEIMLDNPERDWGDPFYPVVEKPPYYPSTSG